MSAEKKSEKRTSSELVREFTVPTDWAEAMHSKGHLRLSPEKIHQLKGRATVKLPADLLAPLLQPAAKKSPIQWIEPLDAVHWLAPKVGGDAEAKSVIAERLRDGAIECTFVWTSRGPDIGPVTSRRPAYPDQVAGVQGPAWVSPIEPDGERLRLGLAFWGLSDSWEDDLQLWNWRDGVFVARWHSAVPASSDAPRDHPVLQMKTRMVVSGIRFNLRDIEKISESKVVNAVKRGRTGPRPKQFYFAPVMSRLESEILDGTISRFGALNRRGTQTNLEKEIAGAVTDADGAEPSESTVRRLAQELMKFWRAHSQDA